MPPERHRRLKKFSRKLFAADAKKAGSASAEARLSGRPVSGLKPLSVCEVRVRNTAECRSYRYPVRDGPQTNIAEDATHEAILIIIIILLINWNLTTMLLCSYFRFRQRITARLVYHCLLRQIYVVLRTLYPAVTGNSLTDTLSNFF